jgi:hypothetical protein
MSKFLLTGGAFGLLASSAFAEEKSPEQLREEANRIYSIEGVRQEQYTRVVASGKGQRIGFFYTLNRDCSTAGDVEVRVTKQPGHGAAETVATTNYPRLSKRHPL